MGRGAAGSGAAGGSRKALAQANLDRAVRQDNAVAVVKIDMTGDGVAETMGFDTNGDGIVDAFDLDGDGKIDKFLNLGEDTPPAPTHKPEHKWQSAGLSSRGSGKGEGGLDKRTFGLLSGMKRREDRDEERRTRVAEAEGEAGFAASLFDGAQHRIKMVDDIYMHMLDDQSAAIVLRHAAALQKVRPSSAVSSNPTRPPPPVPRPCLRTQRWLAGFADRAAVAGPNHEGSAKEDRSDQECTEHRQHVP
jgi:hypothetical protein